MKKISTIFNILLITATIYFSVNVFYEILTAKLHHVHLPRPSQEQVSSSADETFRPLSYYKGVMERNLFNVKRESGQELDDLDTEELPETDLKLKLWGTVTGGVEKSYAVIEETTSRKQDLYREGDPIQSATVKRILRERVILSIDGRDEILTMEISSRGKGESTPQTPEPREPGFMADTEDMTIRRAKIDHAIEQGRIMRYARIRPHFENAGVVGFKVTDIKPNSILKKMGLKDGDVITSLDGKKFRTRDDVVNYYRSLPPSSGITLELIRNGEEKAIHYDFD